MENLLSFVPELNLMVWLTVAGVAAFIAVALIVGTVQAAFLERRELNRTLRTVRAIELPDSRAIRRRELATPTSERVLGPALRRLGKFVKARSPAGTIERLEQELKHAGSPPTWDAGRVLAMKIIAPALLVPLAVVLAGLGGVSALPLVLIGILSGLVGWYLPEWILRSKAGQRQETIQKAMPDSLDLLSITVEAGLGFDAALSRVAREIEGPLGQELNRVVQSIQLGEERIEALRDLAERNSVPELKSFVLAMIQADILGISVTQVLEVQAREMRLKRRQRAEERAMKLPVKIVFPLILCIFPALFVVLLGPAVIQIWETIFRAF